MKTIFLSLLFCIKVVATFAQNIPSAPADKAVIYFVRNSLVGMAINFSYFDGDKLIGRFNAPKYIRYECNAGKHLFWARSENRDFVEAEVEAGKIYFLHAVPQIGLLKARVTLEPVDTSDTKLVAKIKKMILNKDSQSFTEQQLTEDTFLLQLAIDTGTSKYLNDKTNGKIFKQLYPTMSYLN
jgi:hypothetical protein